MPHWVPLNAEMRLKLKDLGGEATKDTTKSLANQKAQHKQPLKNSK